MSRDLTLKVQMRDITNGKAKLSSEIIELPANDAVKFVLSGEAELSSMQKTPPFPVLEKVTKFTNNLRKLGPLTSEPSTFEKIDEFVFRNGLRQTMVAGEPLHWSANLEEVRQMVETCLCDCTTPGGNVFAQLNAVCTSEIRNAPDIHSISRLSEEYMKKENLVPHPHSDHLYDYDDTHYHKLNPDWYRFYHEINALNESVQKSFDHAFLEGRILVVEDTPKGDRLVSPDLVPAMISNTRNIQLYYLLTRDLPKKWFRKVETLDETKARAKNWLERAYEEIAPIGKRWSGKNICIVMTEKFELSDDAAKDVWRKADIPNRDKTGNIPINERADINELKKFN